MNAETRVWRNTALAAGVTTAALLYFTKIDGKKMEAVSAIFFGGAVFAGSLMLGVVFTEIGLRIETDKQRKINQLLK